MSEGLARSQEIFSTLETDTIGEIMNITMGSAATAASSILDNKVVITSPNVNLIPLEEFNLGDMEPAIAVDIKYVEGIFGSNILILRREDMRTILSQMLNKELPVEFEMDDMAISALGELMNQMMGASATVLSSFLGQTINISTPYTIPISEMEAFKADYFGEDSHVVAVEFTISIEGVMESKFVSTMKVGLAKEIIKSSLEFDSQSGAGKLQASAKQKPKNQAPQSRAEGEISMAQTPENKGMPQAAQPFQQPAYQQPYMPPQGYAPQPPYYGAPGAVPPQGYGEGPAMVKDYDFNDFSQNGVPASEATTNLDLVMNVPVVVTVELGRTKRKIKEILEFGQGTIVELDKQAGSQVDVIVNGQLIARGDVVVLDDNFSIRITEILKNRDNLSLV